MGEASISPAGLQVQEPPLGSERIIEVVPELSGLFPDAGLRRGGVVGVSGAAGSTSLFLALLAMPLTLGSWAGVVGIPGLGPIPIR